MQPKNAPLNWNDLQDFLAVASAGQMARAGSVIGVDPTTIARRLRRLEARLGRTLFEQSRSGQILTESGHALLEQVEAMAQAAQDISIKANADRGISGNLRISVSEGFGSKFLTRYIKDFGAAHPALTLDLVANSGFLSPSKREADIAVMLSRPKAGPVLSRKLANYKLKLYASFDYLQHMGSPDTLRDLRKDHTLVGYVPDLVFAPELNYLGEFESGLTARIRSSSINAQLELLRNGVGIGVLPCFIGDLAQDLTVIFTEQSITRSFWLVTHRDTQNLMRVKAGKEWLQHCVREGKGQLFPGD